MPLFPLPHCSFTMHRGEGKEVQETGSRAKGGVAGGAVQNQLCHLLDE